MAGVIVLFGATGYTGRRVAQAMVRRGLRPILAGRNIGGLSMLASRLGDLKVVHADVRDAASVRALIGGRGVLVSTVGPFIRLGGPALRAATEAGGGYPPPTRGPPLLPPGVAGIRPAGARTHATPDTPV